MKKLLVSTIIAAACLAQDADPLASFDRDKFGMFIHWGLYSIPAGEWKGQYVRGIGEWIMFRARIPVTEYEQLATRFNPVRFDANNWAGLAKDSGMRYLVITSKHHDGFAMYGSKASAYNIVDATPFRRDPMKELTAACTARGIGFGAYYSQDQDWHEPGGRGNNWDFKDPRDSQGYLSNKVLPQVKELLTGYGKLSLLWFDTPGMLSLEQVKELRKTVKTLQPSCLLNSRIGHDQGDYFQTGDNAIPLQVYGKSKWEVPATLNDTWGFKKNDKNWKDPADLIAKLADIVSKGGNYLLNVGPDAMGVIPDESQRVLRTIGKWLASNGESIYGTSPSPFFYPDVTWRCTVKPGKLYLHLIQWPGKEFRWEGLENKVKRARFLANGKEVKFRQSAGSVHFTLPDQPVDPFDSVLVLDLEGDKVKVKPGFESTATPARTDLYAWTSRLRGEEIRYDRATVSASGFKTAETERNELWWYPYGSLNGEFAVEVTYAADDANAGSEFRIAVQQSNRGDGSGSKATGTITGTGGKFVTRMAQGSIRVTPGDQHVSFGLAGDGRSAAVRVQKVTLIRK